MKFFGLSSCKKGETQLMHAKFCLKGLLLVHLGQVFVVSGVRMQQ